jgi:hypothetical protein
MMPCVSYGQIASMIELRNEAQPGAFRLVNKSETAVALSTRVKVERLRDGSWIETPIHMTLTEKCSPRPKPTCITLDRGQTIEPVRWTGYTCSGQCPRSCRSNHFAGPGEFRFVIESCDGTQRLTGTPFAMPDKR